MTPILYYHALSSYCWKPLIALYENGTDFTRRHIDFSDPADQAALHAVWPMDHFPVLRDEARGRTIVESSIIIEYLDRQYPGVFRAIPQDADQALEVRMWDRIFDNYVMTPVQRIIFNRIRPVQERDLVNVANMHERLIKAYDMIETHMAGRDYAVGDGYSLADIAASPSLYYANRVQPFGNSYPVLTRYLAHLLARPSFARVLEESQPYQQFFPEAE